MDGGAISFGPFRLLAGQRLLLEGDRPVRLGGRAFDILAALVERAGEVVSKEELIARVWPQTFVEESNLKIQMSALRRALGDGQGGQRYVITIAGRGYNFVAPVSVEAPSPAPAPPPIASANRHNLPLAATRMIGREDSADAIVSRLAHQRLVTVVGPGGIGKTTLALAVAERMIASYEHGVWLVDLAPVTAPRQVASAVAAALGLEINTEDPLPSLIANFRDKRALLLLDNCDHVIEAAASISVAVLRGAPGVTILATSREPLGVSGEHAYRLGPLGSPQPSSNLTAAEALAFPAVQLFVERVGASVEDFVLTDANTQPVVEICRRLDGLPLAIEFAAPRVAVLGIEGLAAGLDDNLPLLGTRNRTAIPRHRTMRAVLDWSYGLLSEKERIFLRALGIFAGAFTVDAASAVAVDPAQPRIDAIELIADLVAKSLVIADVSGSKPRFRLLETTRAYAIEKLDESGEREAIARRHAEHYRNLFERAEIDAGPRPRIDWLADNARELDNVRTALDWAFSGDGGDESIGVALTAATIPLWMHLSLLEECRRRVKQALGAVRPVGDLSPRLEMKLQTALGASTSYASEMGAAFAKAFDLAESIGDSDYQLRALRGLYFYHVGGGRNRVALPFAQKFHDIAANGSDLNDRLFGERMMGVAQHFLGDQSGARRHLEYALAHYPAANHAQDAIRFQADLRVSTRVFLARVLWLQGFPDQAVRAAEMSIGEAQATGHGLTLSFALALAGCTVALWVGNLEAAAHYCEMLLDHSAKRDLPLWSEFGSRIQRVVEIKRGDLEAVRRLLPANLDEIAEPDFRFRLLTGISELAEAMVHAGRTAEGFAVVEAGIAQSESGWLMPELLRLKGELTFSQSSPTAAEAAEDLFRQALAAARRQETLSWQLRAATSLARLLRQQGRDAEARTVLHPIYDRFTEGFENSDLIAAKRLLDKLTDSRDR